MTRSRIRLPADVYALNHPCSVTVCVRNRLKVFRNADIAAGCTVLLTAMSQQYDLPIYAYCLMPDHAHLLMSASERMDIVRFIGLWK